MAMFNLVVFSGYIYIYIYIHILLETALNVNKKTKT